MACFCFFYILSFLTPQNALIHKYLKEKKKCDLFENCYDFGLFAIIILDNDKNQNFENHWLARKPPNLHILTVKKQQN